MSEMSSTNCMNRFFYMSFFGAEICVPINGKGDLFYPIHYLQSRMDDKLFRDKNASAVDRSILIKDLKMIMPIHYFKNMWGKISRL